MINLDYRDAKPIYEQVKDGIRKLIISGIYMSDEKLPSVRELASKLAINPNTIAHAYAELESEGYIYTVNGKGTFVSPNRQVMDCRMRELMTKLDEVVSELLFLAVSPESLRDRIGTIAERGIGNDTGK